MPKVLISYWLFTFLLLFNHINFSYFPRLIFGFSRILGSNLSWCIFRESFWNSFQIIDHLNVRFIFFHNCTLNLFLLQALETHVLHILCALVTFLLLVSRNEGTLSEFPQPDVEPVYRLQSSPPAPFTFKHPGHEVTPWLWLPSLAERLSRFS
jgi:hypothetical protein